MRSIFLVALTYCILMRFVELYVSRRNEAQAIRLGGRRIRPDATGALVLVHTLWFVGLIAEEAFIGPQPMASWVTSSFWAAAVGAELLRLWCMLTLGERWNVAVVVRPAEPLVRRGPYRWLSHPNYVAVVLLLVAMPLALGLPWVAAAIIPLKAWALRKRLRVENEALGANS